MSEENQSQQGSHRDRERYTAEVELKNVQYEEQYTLAMELQQKQLRLERQQIELERKQLELERREFEFEKKQLLITNNHNHYNNNSTTPTLAFDLSTFSAVSNMNELNNTNAISPSANINHNNNNDNKENNNLQSLTPIILQIIEDYDAIKYLLGQPVLDASQVRSDIKTLSTSIAQLQSNLSSLQSQTQPQLQYLSSKVDQFTNLNEFVTNDQCINLIKQNINSIKQRIDENTQRELKDQLDAIFVQNRKSPPKGPNFCYQFENLPGIQSSCGYPFENRSLHDIFYFYLLGQYLSHHLTPLQETILSSKLYISSPSVLNGQWIQIQGDGAVIDKKTAMLYDFVKAGDNKTPVTSCDSKCSFCKGNVKRIEQADDLRYFIKFKWQ